MRIQALSLALLFQLLPAAAFQFSTVSLSDPLFKPGAKYDYLIIAPNDTGILAECRKFARLKWEKGLQTLVVNTDSIIAHCSGHDVPAKIRNCIQYADSVYGITWVLIVGDYALVPTKRVIIDENPGDTAFTDLYLSCLRGTWVENSDGLYEAKYPTIIDGARCGYDSTGAYSCRALHDTISNNIWSNVYIGRLPASNADEARIMLGKIVTYTSQSQSTLAAQHVLLFSPMLSAFCDSWEHFRNSSTAALFQTGSVFSNALLTEEYPDSITESGVVTNIPHAITVSGLRNDFGAGPNLAIFYAHGCFDHIRIDNQTNAFFSSHDVEKNASTTLSNIITISCNTLQLIPPDTMCFGKSFLVNPNGGGVAYFGNTGPTGLCGDDISNILNPICAGTSFRIAKSYQTFWFSLDDWFDGYTLQCWGDPEMEIWTRVLGPGDSIFLSAGRDSSRLVVQTDPPLDSVLVCLYKPNSVFMRAWSKAGIATFDSLPPPVDSIKITATIHNRLPGHLLVNGRSFIGVVERGTVRRTHLELSVRIRHGTMVIGNSGRYAADLSVFDISGRVRYAGIVDAAGKVTVSLPAGFYILRTKLDREILTRNILLPR